MESKDKARGLKKTGGLTEDDAIDKINKLVMIMIESLNINELIYNIEINSFTKKISEICEGTYQNSSIIIGLIEKKLKCIVCQDKYSEIVLKCTHGYCKNCLINTISTQTNELIITNNFEENLSPKCFNPSCKYKIMPSDFKVLYERNWDYLQKMSRKRKIEYLISRNLKIKCTKCCIRYPNTMFLYSCYEICVNCISEYIRYGDCKCPKCGLIIDLKENYRLFINAKCSICEKEQSYIDDFMITFSDGHNHCIPCLNEAWNTHSCRKCLKNIENTIELQFIYKKLFKTCEICKEVKLTNCFVDYQCCKNKICYECQSRVTDFHLCILCNDEIPERCCEKINEILSRTF
ncbi:hypothetical protein SteCoe_38513 [Stentor coeruleus]|uniref:Zinc finger C3HC4 RING-type domain-containing protein n=1 Tax=Stentor coeruleus TaxID=5963 RepID=A0A1R2ALE3_9CILI|nr:hypothetical protein SteCoe_38513 [Stentor coeruleus]